MDSPNKKGTLRRSLILLVLAVVAIAGVFGGAYMLWGWETVPSLDGGDGLPAGEFLSWEEHDRIYQSDDEPYVLRLTSAAHAGEVLYVGTFHTSDPDDEQIAGLARTWDEFEPTIGLCESRLGFYIGGLRGGVRMFGEAGAQYALGRRRGIPVFSLEPVYEDEVAALLEVFPAEHVAAFFTLRVYWNERADDPDGVADELMMHLARKRTDVEGLRGCIESADDLDRIWQRDFPDLPDWREPPADHGAEALQAIADADREVRGRHMAGVLKDQIERGERVLAVVGRSHVIRQEPILRAALGDDHVRVVELADAAASPES